MKGKARTERHGAGDLAGERTRLCRCASGRRRRCVGVGFDESPLRELAELEDLVRVRDDVAKRLCLLELVSPLGPCSFRVRPQDIRAPHRPTALDDVGERVDRPRLLFGRRGLLVLVLSADEAASQTGGGLDGVARKVSEVDETERDGLQRDERR